jgi:succinate dehydrogenase / fumarate reductase cytochrome b subunit
LLNGIRHLVWDTGRALDIKTAYAAGWLVLIGTVVLTAILLGVLF